MRVETDEGLVFELGATEATPTIGIIDYSRRVTDDFGVTTVVPRGFARRMSVRLGVPFDAVDALQRQLAALRASAALWVADDRFASLSIRGFYKDFSLDLAVPPLSFCTLTVEGLAETDAIEDDGRDPAPADQVSTLNLLLPVEVTGSVLAISTVAEDDYPEWVSDHIYAAGDRVIGAATHRIYESAAAGNIGHDPVSPDGNWIDIGATNRWAMFDQALGSATVASGSMTVTLDAAGMTAVALLDVAGATVRLQASEYDRTVEVTPGTIAFLDLPAPVGRVTVTVTGSDISVGTLLIGSLVGLGITEASPTAGITDFSRKDIDDFGEVTIVQRAWAKRMTANALIATDAVDVVANRLAGVRATPALWIGQVGMDSLTIYGFFKDFSIEIGQVVSKLSLSIEGLSAAAKPAPLTAAIDWPAVGDPTGTKPADNATNSGDPDSPFGGGTVGGAIEQLGLIEPMAEAVDLLGQADAGKDAARRQMDRDLARIGETLLRLTSEAGTAREVLRDAGIAIDPDTGTVRIYAVDQLVDRTSNVELSIDGVTSTLTAKASVDYVNEKILAAQLDPSQIAGLDDLIARVSTAETEIDGLNAAVTLRATLTELTNATGRITTVEQGLSAVEGAITTKAEQTTVDALATTVGSVEQTLQSLGDVSGITVTIRQARAVADDGAEATLRALFAGDQANTRQIAAQAQARQEIYTKIEDGLSVEAAARTLLDVKVGDVDARLATEILTRVSGDAAVAQQITALGVTQGGLSADLTSFNQARIDGDAANASSITQVSARLDGVGGVGVETAISAVTDRLGAIEGRYTVTIDVNGNLTGFQLIGSDAGPGTLNLINTDLRMGTGRVIFNNGTFMLVQGIGFGEDNAFVEWYGPSRATIAGCSFDEAISYKTNDGRSVFRGAIGANGSPQSVVNNVVGTSQLMSPQWPKAGTSMLVQAAFSYSASGSRSQPTPPSDPSVTLVLYRTLGSTAEAEVGRKTVIGSAIYEPDLSPSFYSQEVSASLTYVDADSSPDLRSWRLVISLDAQPPGGTSARPDEFTQSMSITSTPQA